MANSWRKLENMPLGREATLGNALRAWMRLNDAKVLDAATHLQESGVRGSAANIHNWLDGNPTGELFSVRAASLLACRVLVRAATGQAAQRFPLGLRKPTFPTRTLADASIGFGRHRIVRATNLSVSLLRNRIEVSGDYSGTFVISEEANQTRRQAADYQPGA